MRGQRHRGMSRITQVQLLKGCSFPIMQINKTPRPTVGADLSCPQPIYRPSGGVPLSDLFCSRMSWPKSKIREVFFCECMVNCSCSRNVWLQRALKDRALPHSARSLLARSHAKQGGMLFTSDTSEIEI